MTAPDDWFERLERQDRGWVPSPGDWTPPAGKRGGRDWVPPGGARERLDRVPRWVRLWLKVPLGGRGRREGWLWDHGGYDVEGPEATAERERRDAAYEAQHSVIRAALDSAGPWPAAARTRTQPVEVVDVDHYGEFAAVVAAVASDPMNRLPMLQVFTFSRTADGWQPHGGGGSGSGSDPLDERFSATAHPFSLRSSSRGWTSLEAGRHGHHALCNATVLCGPDVTRVRVERPGLVREADVSGGSGWVGIVWPEGSEPQVKAMDAAGMEVETLDRDVFRQERRGHRPPRRIVRRRATYPSTAVLRARRRPWWRRRWSP